MGEQNAVAVFGDDLGLSAVRVVCLLFESTVCTVSTTTTTNNNYYSTT